MKKVVYIFILLFSIFLNAWGQGSEEDMIRTPAVADMLRYGSIPVSQYAGRLDLEIPLTIMKDQDFDFPISLKYNSSGFMPMKNDGLVGQNWSISCGGVISREIKGIADDKPVYKSNKGSYDEYGFLYFLKNKDKYDPAKIIGQTESYLFSGFDITFPYPRFYTQGVNNREYIEPSSDVYNFSFGEYSGKFMINFDGSANIISNDGRNYEIDLSQYTYATFRGETRASSITITTDNGYKYVFGGTYDAMEYSLQWQNGKPGTSTGASGFEGFQNLFQLDDFHIDISAFHLSQIIAPSGKKLEIEYEGLPADFYNIDYNRMYNALKGEQALNYSKLFSVMHTNSYHISFADNDALYMPSENHAISHTLTKQALIKAIRTERQTIQFFYTQNEKSTIADLYETRGDLMLPIESVAGAKLSSIYHSSRNINDNFYTLYKQVNFEYIKWRGAIVRSFLNQIKDNIIGDYKMNYNLQVDGPSPLTCDIDHWNYWLYPRSGNSLIPSDLISGAQVIGDDVNYRKQGKRDVVSGGSWGAGISLLASIKYPTGGASLFEYERHDYSREIIRNRSSNFKPTLNRLDQNLLAGGSRVKSITNTNSDNSIVSSKHFFYRNSIDDIKSSGILNYRPIYNKITKYIHSGMLGDSKFHFQSLSGYYDYSNIGFSPTSYEKDHVVYSSVIECEYPTSQKEQRITYEKILGVSEDLIFPLEFSSINDEVDIFAVPETGSTLTVSITGPNYSKIIEFKGSENSNMVDHKTYRIHELGLCTNTKYKLELKGTWRSKIAFVKVTDNLSNSNLDPQMIINRYRSYDQYPDIFDEKSLIGDPPAPGGEIGFYLYMDPIDRSNYRGHIKDRLFYNEKKQLVKKEVYDYYDILSSKNSGFYFFKPAKAVTKTPTLEVGAFRTRFGSANLPSFQKVPIQEHFLKLKTINSVEYYYSSENSLQAKDSTVMGKTYTYTIPYYYQKTETIRNSSGESHSVSYKYPFEMQSGSYQEMMKKNVLTPVVETVKRRRQSEVLTRNNLALINGYCRPTSVETSIGGSPLRTDIIYHRYDDFGRPIEFTGVDGLTTVMIWSYSGLYPIAEIKNATYNDVLKALNILPESFSSALIVDLSKIETLRTNLKVPNALVTTYTYKPLVGMTSMTDPRGVTTTYEYDAFGRLSKAKDVNGKVIQSYDYHYQGQ